jgi:hypothetical protein
MRAGFTNEYLINTGAPAALRYNDRSVNENGHCALGFEILLKRSNNFLEVHASPGLRPMTLLPGLNPKEIPSDISEIPQMTHAMLAAGSS